MKEKEKKKQYAVYHHQKSPMFYLLENLRNANEQIAERLRLGERRQKKRCVSSKLCLAKCLHTWGVSVVCLSFSICPVSAPFIHYVYYVHRRRRRLRTEETNQKRIAHQMTMEKNWNANAYSKCGTRQKASWADADFSKSMGSTLSNSRKTKPITI